ncbi:MAG: hypothetical protein ACK5LX_12915 [Oscillospiraceae bacterium]
MENNLIKSRIAKYTRGSIVRSLLLIAIVVLLLIFAFEIPASTTSSGTPPPTARWRSWTS